MSVERLLTSNKIDSGPKSEDQFTSTLYTENHVFWNRKIDMKQNQEEYELLIVDYYANKMIARTTNLYKSYRQPMKCKMEQVTFQNLEKTCCLKAGSL